MNLDNLITWSVSVVLGFAAIGKIDTLQMWIWKAQARVVHESRSSNWSSPRFFANKLQQRKGVRPEPLPSRKVNGYKNHNGFTYVRLADIK